jgi:cation:H+ antiporter
VRGAATLALRLGLTPLVIGLTVVAFGTSAPELVVSVESALAGAGGIAVGNVVGSNIANIGLILASAALLRAFDVNRLLIRRDMPIMIAVSSIAVWMLWDGTLGRPEGLLLVGGLVGYVTWSVISARAETAAQSTEASAASSVAAAHADGVPDRVEGSAGRDVLWIAAGLGALAYGADVLVSGAVGVATLVGVSQTVIGLTVVAIGTSLPEMATSVVAALRGQSEIAAGNIVGSNLFNVLCILGIAAVVRPLDAPEMEAVDFSVMLAFSAVALVMMATGRRMSRWEGAVLLAFYVAYIGYLATTHT